jgi:hypothetical protein
MKATVDNGNVSVPLLDELVMGVDYLMVFLPERFPCPTALDFLHIEGFLPAF